MTELTDYQKSLTKRGKATYVTVLSVIAQLVGCVVLTTNLFSTVPPPLDHFDHFGKFLLVLYLASQIVGMIFAPIVVIVTKIATDVICKINVEVQYDGSQVDVAKKALNAGIRPFYRIVGARHHWWRPFDQLIDGYLVAFLILSGWYFSAIWLSTSVIVVTICFQKIEQFVVPHLKNETPEETDETDETIDQLMDKLCTE
jgi:hypothetical protein